MRPGDFSTPDDPVEALVRAYLDRQAEQVDPASALARVARTLADPSRRPEPEPEPSAKPIRRRGNRWPLGLALASAALLLLAVGVFTVPARPLSAESIVRRAQVVHASPLDRCYRVETDFEFTPLDGDPTLIVRPRQTRLWTRGDRFWAESDVGSRHINWGRDGSGGLWLAFGPHRGLRFDPAEVPPAVGLRCDVLSVRLETLLGEVLTDFDLTTDPERPTVITARPRPGGRKILREVVLEVDPATDVLKRLELTRSFAGRIVTTRFQLEEARELDDSRYRLEGHLEAPYQINAPEIDPQRRRQILLRLFGLR